MSTKSEGCTWDVMETRLFENGAKLLEVVLQAAQARAAQGGSEVIADLLHRADLAPRLVVAISGATADELTMGVWLHSRATGEPVARIFEITAQGDLVPSCFH